MTDDDHRGDGPEREQDAMPDDLRSLLDALSEAATRDTPSAILALRRRLRRTARGYLGANDVLRVEMDSEDLVHDALVKLIRAAPGFRGTTWAEFFAFARTVLSREKIDRARAQQRKPPRDGEGVPALEENTPSRICARNEEVARLEAQIDALAEPYRVPLRLRLEERTYSEIAQLLGITEATARQRVSRAIAMLRRQRRGG